MTSFEQEVIERLARIEAHTMGLPERVSALERFRSKILGGVAVITFGVSLVVETIFHHKAI